MTKMRERLVLMSLALLLSLKTASAFVVPRSDKKRNNNRSVLVTPKLPSAPSSTALFASASSHNSPWLQEFATASGEIVDPYDILKISRSASQEQVRQSYLHQSRRYHPDGARQRKYLPGKCSNMEDVREHWERIKLSYEIL